MFKTIKDAVKIENPKTQIKKRHYRCYNRNYLNLKNVIKK